MSHRLQIVLQDPVATQLRALADGAQEPPSTVAAQLVREGVADASEDGRVRRLRVTRTVPAGDGNDRARWLEPYGGDSSWRGQMWGAVVALRGRYPRLLEPLKDGWWADESHTETLCAFATWRAEIDDRGTEPREELTFQAELAAFSRVLREQGGGVAKTWVPGPPPSSWTTP